MMDDKTLALLQKVADIDKAPKGAYNFRVNGISVERNSTDTVAITAKENGSGIDITVRPHTKNEYVHIPVMITETDFTDKVYNDFYIGEGSDVVIVAGCGIHNTGEHLSQHDGIHMFHLAKNAKVKYVENHYGTGTAAKKVLNPVTVVNLDEGAYLEMETVQIEGVDETKRVTKGEVGKNATLFIREIIMTTGTQTAYTEFEVNLNGENSHSNVTSRSVAKDSSYQKFYSVLNGNNACTGHSECDAILMGNAKVSAIPVVTANHASAELIHEAAIGKIAGEQIIKLKTLGLTNEEAETEIIKGFLK